MADEKTSYDERLAAILHGSAAVFAEKGYHQASIRDIARATGVSLSGLYYYVKGKEELLFLIQDRSFARVLESLERELAGERDPLRRFRLLVRNHLRFFASNMVEMKVLSHEADSLTGEFRRRVNARKKRYTELCEGILAELQPVDTPVDLRVATFSLFGMMNWIYNWYRPDRDVGVDRLAEQMGRLFLEGFLGADGARPAAGPAEDAAGVSAPPVWRR